MSIRALFDGYLMKHPRWAMDQNITYRKINEIYRFLVFDGCLTGEWKTPAWIDGGIGKVGYEINFNREFFTYQLPRSLAEIDAELAEVEKRIMGMLREVTE